MQRSAIELHAHAHDAHSRGQSLRSQRGVKQRVPATPLVAQLVPRHLPDGGVLRTGAREVDDDEFLALAAGLRAVADLADLGVDVGLGHRAVGDRRPELADLGRLLRQIGDVLRGLEDVGGDLLLRRLVASGADNSRMRLEPALLEARRAPGPARKSNQSPSRPQGRSINQGFGRCVTDVCV